MGWRSMQSGLKHRLDGLERLGWTGGSLPALGLSLLLVLLVFVLSLSRPPHLDEESYLSIGRAVWASPLRPYDWTRPWPPDFLPHPNTYWYAHPPLFLEWQGLLTGMFGESVWLKRLFSLPFLLGTLRGLWALCQRFLRQPEVGLLGLLSAPALLLVLSSSLMIDLPLLMFSLGAIGLGWSGAVSRRPGQVVLGGCLLGLACLTKYPALLLFPLGWFLPSPARERMRMGLRWVGPALLLVGLWQLVSLGLYGTPHLVEVLRQAGGVPRSPLSSRLVGLFVQLGLTVVPLSLSLGLTLSMGLGWRQGMLRTPSGLGVRLTGLLGLGLAGLVGLGLWLKQGFPLPTLGIRLAEKLTESLVDRLPTSLPMSGLLLGGLLLGAFNLRWLDTSSREARFLSLWAGLVLLGVLLGHNFVSARYLVLASVPLTLLPLRRWELMQGPSRTPELSRTPAPAQPARRPMWQWVALGLLGPALSLGLVVADDGVARKLEALAQRGIKIVAAQKLAQPEAAVYFTGEWGLRWRFEQAGMRYLSPDVTPPPGSLLLVPERTVSGPLPMDSGWQSIEVLKEEATGLLVHAPTEGISIYSDAMGLLPFGWSLDPVVLERLEVRQVR